MQLYLAQLLGRRLVMPREFHLHDPVFCFGAFRTCRRAPLHLNLSLGLPLTPFPRFHSYLQMRQRASV